jgi:hypothetical protein
MFTPIRFKRMAVLDAILARKKAIN